VPLGGLARRAGYAKSVEAAAGGKAAVLQVDAGRFFAGEPPAGYARVDDLAIKNEWALKAADALAFGAINVTAYDLAFLSKVMEADGYDARLAAHTSLARLVSANVVPADAKHRAFRPYTIVEVASERFGAKPLRVGLLGVAEVPKTGADVAGYKVTDPFAAIKKYAAEVRAKSDVLVVLAYLDKTALRGVEPAAGAVDVIVTAHQNPVEKFSGPVDAPATLVTANETKAVSELRLYPSTAPGTKRVARLSVRYVMLTSDVPDDPAARTLTLDAVKAFRKL
jgi:2',3'-cyclic-nucleotide 2'-phosphodiesterase (5'-nucleotidase family)